jgi:hypothetical protein
MINNTKRWKQLFLFCLGLFLGTAFCMKWMEGDFRQNGSLFTIIGLEATYSKERVISILSGLDESVKTIVRYHLCFDFAFMAGVYPGIACLCMMARSKRAGKWIRGFLLALALLQLVAWGFDIIENYFLLSWLKAPESLSSFGVYHTVVYAKWLIALAGVLAALVMFVLPGKKSTALLVP